MIESDPVNRIDDVSRELVGNPRWFVPLFPGAFLRSAMEHRSLIWRLSKRQIQAKYRGSVLGILWALLHPILMLAVFTFVFSVVFQIRWGVDIEGRGQFALVMFAGLLVYNIFSQCLIQAPLLITAYPNFVKKVVFPLEILPWTILLEALFNAALGSVVLVIVYIFVIGPPPVTFMLVPCLLLPLVFFMMGVMWVLSSVGVYFRDLGQVTTVLATMFLFLSPIFYPLSSIPEKYRVVILLSPVTQIIEDVRRVLFWGQMPKWDFWIVSLAVGLVAAWLGFVWFMGTKKGFSDVL